MAAAVPDRRIVEAALSLLEDRLRTVGRRPLVFGICGAQGSGKSTLANALARELAGQGRRVAVLSLDDLYLIRAERQELATRVHSLFATRGVPGTHDVALGLELIAALERGEAAALPRFDKRRDERVDQADWPRAPEHCEVLILEGWCLGAAPQDVGALARPVNALEAAEDPDGVWRHHVNAALAGPYQALFARIDALVLLAAPGFDVVHGWRMEQEERAVPAEQRMDGAAIARFIAHYERLTRHILSEMPARADLVVRLDPERAPLAIEPRVRDARR